MTSGTRDRSVDVVVVGAGQAGVSLSHHLASRAIEHVVIERDSPFSAWRNRWDGFHTNTPNWMNTLPVLPDGTYPSGDPHTFATRDEMVSYLDECLAAVDPPVVAGVEVVEVATADDGSWRVETTAGAYTARCVALCHGAMSRPRIPDVAGTLPPHVPQFHSSAYRNPSQISTGSVLVVGSASSGVQICRLLAESGHFHDVHLAVSSVRILPRHVLGVQVHRFLHAFGLFDMKSDSGLGRLMYSRLETKGDPILRPGPRDLARDHGVRLHSRLVSADGPAIRFADGQTLDTDDLTIIWCTGFTGDYGLLTDPRGVIDEGGAPIHRRGVATGAPGLYFVGLRYQHTVASHDIYGVSKDAAYVAAHIEEHLEVPSGQVPEPLGHEETIR